VGSCCAQCWKSADDLTDAVAAELRTEAARATNQPHAIMLAGGSTPLAAYARLAAQPPMAPGADLHLTLQRRPPRAHGKSAE
jgi:6-phosphogluconolactonase/glucosamine-6-phosphate isomerase/deaminase